jgi:ribosomal protein S27AE
MKNTKRCPKCEGANIVRIEGYVGAYGTGNNVMVGSSIFSAVKVNRYVCCSCGFTEEWIDTEELEKVEKSKKAKSL